MEKKIQKIGPDRGSNPEPLAPKARIIPLDHQAFDYFVNFYSLSLQIFCDQSTEKFSITKFKSYIVKIHY